MKILLDTHTALWLVNDYEKLSKNANEILATKSNKLYVSHVSIWEIAIKNSIGKLPELDGGVKAFMSRLGRMPIKLLKIKLEHIEAVEKLDLIHRDPFDRLLITTALTEGMTILTADGNIHKYDINTIW